MKIGVLFWVLMILWIVFGLFVFWPTAVGIGVVAYAPLGVNVLLWVLLFLLGWAVFGAPLQK